MNIEALRDIEPWQWPRNAAATIRGVLMDRQAKPSDRLIAVELAGDYTIISDDMDNALLTVLSDASESDQMRARAAISLGPVLETMYMELDDDDPPITDGTLQKIHFTLETVYLDTGNSKELRRKVLEGSVRFPQPWHEEAIRSAYASGDREWMLTAVFGMRNVRGFDDSILEALKNPDPEIHYEAVKAASTWALDGAWPHVAALADDPRTPKDLRLAAIGAVGSIRPAEAGQVLADLADSTDEEVADAADEAIESAQAELAAELDDEDDEDDDDL